MTKTKTGLPLPKIKAEWLPTQHTDLEDAPGALQLLVQEVLTEGISLAYMHIADDGIWQVDYGDDSWLVSHGCSIDCDYFVVLNTHLGLKKYWLDVEVHELIEALVADKAHRDAAVE